MCMCAGVLTAADRPGDTGWMMTGGCPVPASAVKADCYTHIHVHGHGHKLLMHIQCIYTS